MSDPSLWNSGPSMGSLLSLSASATLKRTRAASAPCESEEARQRKRSRASSGSIFIDEKIPEQSEDDSVGSAESSSLKDKGKEKESSRARGEDRLVLGATTATVIEDLFQELKCGCCTELCYNPVLVNPCQHFFCGSCCVLWVRNGGTNCPACRGVSTTVTPSRVIQSMIDLLLRSDPSKARTTNERAQADQVYKAGTTLRLPTPRPVTPEPNLEPVNDNFARPCPTCLPGNAYGWRCPVPIVDPVLDQENAFDLDDGTPPGHVFCGNCDQLHNLQAPTSSKCDFCQVSFCGVGIQGRCCALSLLSQQPQGMSELQDLILNGNIYDCFQRNSVEVDILVDYLRTNEISLRGVYKEIVIHTLHQPQAFASLIDSGIFDDLHPVSGGDDPDPTAARRRICRLCAAQVLIHGLRDWWLRERRQDNLPAEVTARKDCPQGSGCDKQTDPAHAKEFNHMIHVPVPAPANEPPAPGPSFRIFPPSFHSLATRDPLSNEQGPAAQPSDVDMQLPPPSDNNPSSFIEHAFTFMSPASLQTEVEAMASLSRLAEGSSNGGARAVPLPASNTPPWVRGDSPMRSRIFFSDPPAQAVVPAPSVPPQIPEDVVMTDVDEEDAKDDHVGQPQEEDVRAELESSGEQTEQVPKMPSPSRTHPIALSPSA